MTSDTGSFASPFERALGAQFHRLAPQVRQLHGGRVSEWRGQVSVAHGRGGMAALARRAGGFPPAMERAPFALSVEPSRDGAEIWIRSFDGFETRSRLWHDPQTGQLLEQFGAVTCALSPTEKLDALQIQVDGGWLWRRVPLPGPVVPRSEVSVWQDEAGRYRFDISAGLQWGGPVIHYQGWLRAAN